MNDLTRILNTFLTDDDWSIAAANELEARIDGYSDTPGVQDLLDVLASYRPGGGAYLYNKEDLGKILLSLIESLRDSLK
jgi:hypothetical protein